MFIFFLALTVLLSLTAGTKDLIGSIGAAGATLHAGNRPAADKHASFTKP